MNAHLVKIGFELIEFSLKIMRIPVKDMVQILAPDRSNEPFHELPNLLMSCNRSSWTKAMLAGRTRDVAENIRRLKSGSELINRVDSGAGPEATTDRIVLGNHAQRS